MYYVRLSSLEELRDLSPINLTGVRLVNCSDKKDLQVLIDNMYDDLGSIFEVAAMFNLGHEYNANGIGHYLFDRRASYPFIVIFYDYDEEKAFILECDNSMDFLELDKFIKSIIIKPMLNESSESYIKSEDSKVSSFRCYDKLNY